MIDLHPQARVIAYAETIGKRFPASIPVVPSDGRIYATWIMGNNYRNKSRLYGAYPPAYLDRITKLYPYSSPERTLHLFAGSLEPGPYVRFDLMKDEQRDPDVQGNVVEISQHFGPDTFDVVYADPPYSNEDAAKYGSGKLPTARLVFRELAKVVKPGGFCIWMDTRHPMNRKLEWILAGAITVIRSSNHRYRVVTIWQRVGEVAGS